MSDDYNYILGAVLAMGGAPPEGRELPFDTLVLCALEHQPPSLWFPNTRVMRVMLDDSGPPPTQTEILAAVAMGREVARQLRHGRRVLVTCWKGRNRSGLVTGIALLELGLSCRAAFFNIRYARGLKALNNEHFVEVLRRYRPHSALELVNDRPRHHP
jgi:hypothetical protein